MKNEIIKLAQEKCKEYLKEKYITYHPSYVWLCRYIAEQVYEQILKDAMEGKVNQDGFLELSNGEVIDICPTLKRCALGLHIGDKVKLIIVKDNDTE